MIASDATTVREGVGKVHIRCSRIALFPVRPQDELGPHETLILPNVVAAPHKSSQLQGVYTRVSHLWQNLPDPALATLFPLC